MASSAVIRKYKSADLDDLMAVWESANSMAHPFLPAEYVAQVRHDIPALYIPNADTWVAEYDRNLVGFISLIDNEIGAVFVLTERHGMGFGFSMVNQALQLHSRLEVEVFKNNTVGRRFYERFGFQMMYEYIHAPTKQSILRLQYAFMDPNGENMNTPPMKSL